MGFACAYRAALASLLLASALAVTRDASACTPPPDGWRQWGGIPEVPTNGVVVVHYACYARCGAAPDPESFTLTSPEGEEVPGEVVLTGGADPLRFVAFRPDAGAMVEGESYEASLEGVTFVGPFTAVAAVEWTDSRSVTEEFRAVDYKAGDEVCCTGPLDSCGGKPCFWTQYRREASLSVAWADPDAVSFEDLQYAYRILYSGQSDVEPAWAIGDVQTSYVLASEGASTCYTLELLRLADDTVVTFPERCLDRPDELVPGLYDASAETIDVTLSRCEAPPPGFEEPWCARFEPLCSDDDPQNDRYCTTYEASCDARVPGTGGSGSGGAGSSGAGGSGASGGSGAAGGSGQPGSEGRTVVTNAGCGCALPGSRLANNPGCLLLAAMVAAWGSRRRQARTRG
jgi:hypothetical protein